MLHYKQKREELDEILWDIEVPRELFHQLVELNDFIFKSRWDHENAQKALDLIFEIKGSIPLTHFKIGKQNEEIDPQDFSPEESVFKS